MRAKVAGGILLVLLMVAMLLRGTVFKPSGGDVDHAREFRNGSLGANPAASKSGAGVGKSSERRQLRDLLPPKVKIEADEVHGTIARGKVRLILPDDTEIWADQVQSSADSPSFLATGRVMVWSKGRTSCLKVRGEPVVWKLSGDSLKVESLEGVEMRHFEVAQTEEQMLELQNAPPALDQ